MWDMENNVCECKRERERGTVVTRKKSVSKSERERYREIGRKTSITAVKIKKISVGKIELKFDLR